MTVSAHVHRFRPQNLFNKICRVGSLKTWSTKYTCSSFANVSEKPSAQKKVVWTILEEDRAKLQGCLDIQPGLRDPRANLLAMR